MDPLLRKRSAVAGDGAVLAVRDLIARYGERQVLRGVSLAVEPAEIRVILGPSGCGKSTLLKHLVGLLEPESGSIRIFARPWTSSHPPSRRLAGMLARERREGLASASTYVRFGKKVASHGARLRGTLVRLQSRGKTLAGYGAPGRGNTLLCHSRIGRDLLPYIVDASPSRYGRFTPGTHIPILPPDEFRKNPPDYALMLAWSYYREIVSKERSFVRGGGRFIVPLPELRVVP